MKKNERILKARLKNNFNEVVCRVGISGKRVLSIC